MLSSTDRSVSFYKNSSVWLDSISPQLGSKPGLYIYIYIERERERKREKERNENGVNK